jgi:hypothetical protein
MRLEMGWEIVGGKTGKSLCGGCVLRRRCRTRLRGETDVSEVLVCSKYMPVSGEQGASCPAEAKQ